MALPNREPFDLGRLTTAELEVVGRFHDASNATLLVHLGPPPAPDVGSLADLQAGAWGVYKPRDGEAPLWDFPTGTLHRREVAAFEVDQALGWGMVPPTVLVDGPAGPGSLQLFVPHDPERHLFALLEGDPPASTLRQVARMVAFDAVVENADRKAGHVLAERLGDGEDRLWLVDHGVTFHVQPHLRTVAWHLAGQPLAPDDREDLARLAGALTAGAPLARRLEELLAEDEVEALQLRVRRLAAAASTYPHPQVDRPLPWPPV